MDIAPSKKAKKKKTLAAEKFPRTISEALHGKWRELFRRGDSIKIAEKLKTSKPTIDRALIYGHVHQQRVVDGITQYFADRLVQETEEANRLHLLNKQNQIANKQGAIAL